MTEAHALRSGAPDAERVPARERILVVDDDESARRALEKLLRGEGFDTVVAQNGEAALAEVARALPDVVLTDLRMYPVDGIELCRRLRGIEESLPVIVMTAQSDVQSAIESLRAGADDYLIKPLLYEELLWRVERALERRTAKRERDELDRKLREQLLFRCTQERTRAQAEAMHAARLDALLENLAEGVAMASADGRVVMLNAAARSILGLGDRDVSTVSDLHAVLGAYDLDEEPLREEERPLARALRGEPFSAYEIVRIRPGGERRRVVSSGTCVRDTGGDVALAIVVFHDVTDVRRLEERREEYLALISHDLRNPLTSIKGFAALIQRALEEEGAGGAERASSSALVDFAERVRQNVDRMTAMLEELTEATRLEAQGVSLRRSACDLLVVVSGVTGRLDDERRKRISVDADGSPYAIVADVERIERVVVNLLSNALKYSESGARVTIRLLRREGEVVMDVVDHGIGIAPESAKRLFERYYRTAEGQSRARGIGLGLYIARQIVEAHGGRIEVTSEIGRGSTFRVRLPTSLPRG